MHRLHQEVVGRFFILVGMLFRGCAFTGPIPLIIVGEYSEPCCPYALYQRSVISDVFRISVAEKNGENRLGIREVGCRNLRSIGTSELQDAPSIPVSRALWLENYSVGEKCRCD